MHLQRRCCSGVGRCVSAALRHADCGASRFRVECEQTGRAWRIHEDAEGRAVVRQCQGGPELEGVFPDIATALTEVQRWIGEEREGA